MLENNSTCHQSIALSSTGAAREGTLTGGQCCTVCLQTVAPTWRASKILSSKRHLHLPVVDLAVSNTLPGSSTTLIICRCHDHMWPHVAMYGMYGIKRYWHVSWLCMFDFRKINNSMACASSTRFLTLCSIELQAG
jgi:hypothetical protein